MKILFVFLIVVLLTACSSSSQPVKNNEQLAEKNKQTALQNEIKRTVMLAQNLEKSGRGLDSLRGGYLPGDKKLCQQSSAEKRLEFEDFKLRVGKLPEELRGKFTSFYDDLDKCFNCEKSATENCKKARSQINELIKQLYTE